ncbi:hypothetical protein [Frigoriglobus tundricola]|uniref:Uncharacterized protein n=1 Tax=Frigoriglobus tundricola TaxID=2774151 RepID=A0A6M5YIF3_9BACT|nr:hypothetical protein [Frigoriglobus tundricola]QJW93046.1 hypothetical protein FTUN_0546 [Frigoriglobus tundricola]
MRCLIALVGLAFACALPTGRADDRPWLQRIAERTPLPRRPVEHSAARAGYPQSVSQMAIPGVTRYDNGGYIGGGSIRNNSLVARGPGSATGPVYDGTFGTDYSGVRLHLGRVFLAPSADPSHGRPIYLAYRAEGHRLPDPFAIRPLRKAVLEAREDREERLHGKEGGGHGSEGGHGAEAGAGKEGGHE